MFLHKIVAGRSDRSYGIQVARLAGLPAAVVGARARDSQVLEQDELQRGGRPTLSGAGARRAAARPVPGARRGERPAAKPAAGARHRPPDAARGANLLADLKREVAMTPRGRVVALHALALTVLASSRRLRPAAAATGDLIVVGDGQLPDQSRPARGPRRSVAEDAPAALQLAGQDRRPPAHRARPRRVASSSRMRRPTSRGSGTACTSTTAAR